MGLVLTLVNQEMLSANCRKEESQQWPDTRSPASFVVCAAAYFFEVQRLFFLPAVGQEALRQQFRIAERHAAFVVADIQPDARFKRQVRRGLVQNAQNAFMVPPDAGRKHRETAKDLGIFQS
jgi:hypothetical protein